MKTEDRTDTEHAKLWRSLSPAQRTACAACCARQWNHNAADMRKAVDAHAAGKYWRDFVDAGVHSTDTTYMDLTRAKPTTVAKLASIGLTSGGYNEVRYTRAMGELISWVIDHDSVKWLCQRKHDDRGSAGQVRELHALGLTRRPTAWHVENGHAGPSDERDWKLHSALRDADRALKRARDQAQLQAVARVEADQKQAEREARAAEESAKREAAKREHIERAQEWLSRVPGSGGIWTFRCLTREEGAAVRELAEAYIGLVRTHVGEIAAEESERKAS